MEFSLTMTTVATRDDAEALAEGIVANRLASCVQIAEIDSVYEWDGKINKGQEFLLMIKGRSDLFARLREFVLRDHKYDLPELVTVQIADGDPRYLAWMGGAAGG